MQKGYAIPLMRLIFPGSVSWMGLRTFLTGHEKNTSPPPPGGIPRRTICTHGEKEEARMQQTVGDPNTQPSTVYTKGMFLRRETALSHLTWQSFQGQQHLMLALRGHMMSKDTLQCLRNSSTDPACPKVKWVFILKMRDWPSSCVNPIS